MCKYYLDKLQIEGVNMGIQVGMDDFFNLSAYYRTHICNHLHTTSIGRNILSSVCQKINTILQPSNITNRKQYFLIKQLPLCKDVVTLCER
jgi:hypothetical protein